MVHNKLIINKYDSCSKLFTDLCKYFNELHEKTNNRFYILPGGETPIPFYKILSSKVKDWEHTNLILSDERIVEPNSNKSNSTLLNKHLIDKIIIQPKPHYIDLNKYIHEKKNIFSINTFDLDQITSLVPEICFLGLGEDGHFASIFPYKIDRNFSTLFITKNSEETFYRISLSFNYILKSKKIVLIVVGNRKSEILYKFINKDIDPLTYPIKSLFNYYEGKILIFCDEDAGYLIEE